MPGILHSDSLLLALGAHTVNALAGYAIAVAVARLVDPAGYGVYATVYALVLAAELIARLGIPVAAARRLSVDRDRSWAGTALSTSLILGAALTLLLFVLATPLAVLVPHADAARLIRLAAPDALFYVPVLTLFTLAPSLGRPRTGSILLATYAVLRTGLTLVGLLLAPRVESALLANIAASGMTLALGCAMLRLAPSTLKRHRLAMLAADAGSDWMRTVALQLLPLAPLWAIGTLGDPVTSGQWAAALSLGRLPQLVAIAAAPLLLAELARQPRARDPRPLVPIVTAFAGTLALTLEAEGLIVLLFGEPFRPAGALAAVLIPGIGLGTTLLQLGSIAALARGRRRAAVALPVLALTVLASSLTLLTASAGPSAGAWAALLIVLPTGFWTCFRELVQPRISSLTVHGLRYVAACVLPAVVAAAVPAEGIWLIAEGLLVAGVLLGALYTAFRSAA